MKIFLSSNELREGKAGCPDYMSGSQDSKMAHLLGSRYCIESLSEDVSDLQATITDVFSRSGPVTATSWKYPDKAANEVDIPGLLKQYAFSEENDDEECQVSHIVLMELVIDRLIVLLQAMSRYMDQMLALSRAPSTASFSPHTSIGLVVKKYWNKMVHTYTTIQQLQSEAKGKSRKIADLENSIKKLNQDMENGTMNPADLNTSGTCHTGLCSACKLGIIDTGSPCQRPVELGRDEYNKVTQTIETAFVPCESCHNVQKCLREVGSHIINICKMQELPSSLAKHRSVIGHLDWMTANDVSRWTNEQGKDLERVNKHLDYLMNTINPLKEDVAKEQKRNADMHRKVEECKKEVALEKETQSTMQKQFEGKIKEVEKREGDKVDNIQRENEELQKNKQENESEISSLQAELYQQEKTIQQLEETKLSLQHNLEEATTNNKEVKRLESELRGLQEQLQKVNQKLHSVQKDAVRERAKNKSANQHTESLQGKHESLLQRLDDLDQENGELREQIAELEEEQDKLQASVERADDEKRELRDELKEKELSVKDLEREKRKLQESIQEMEENLHQMDKQVLDAKERERLLTEYPDLNGPVNPDMIGTGDIAHDMENQIKANNVRIRLLEDQNGTLRNTISKMLSAQSKAKDRGPVMAFGDSVPLWRPPSQREEIDEHIDEQDIPPPALYNEPSATNKPPASSSGKKTTGRQDTFLVTRGPKSAGNKPRSKPAPAHQVDHKSSSISSYMKLKNSGMMKQKERPQSGKVPSTGRTEYEAPEVHTCSKCDKIYNSKKDLEIHKSYCAGF